jgi:hypothetical protein
MWAYEHSIETSVDADRIWRLWEDVAGWGAWNADIEHVELAGPFAAGSHITMTPKGQEPVELTLAEVVPGERFVDEAGFGDVVIRTVHRLTAVGPHTTRVTYRTEITGPAPDDLGPGITADFPETMAALVRAAQAA